MEATFPDDYYKRVLDLLLVEFDEISVAEDPERVINGTLELLSHFLNLNKGRVFLWDSLTSRLEIAYSHGLSPEQIARGKYEIAEGITGEVLETGKSILVENICADLRYKGKVTSIVPMEKRSKSYIAVPIKLKDVTFGVFAVECNPKNDGDMEANALVLKLVVEEMAKVIYKYGLDDFAAYHAA